MLRRTSSVQSVLIYATFFTLSLMIHMIVVWPPQGQAAPEAGPAAAGEVEPSPEPFSEGGSPFPEGGSPSEGGSAIQSTTQTGAAEAPSSAPEVLK